MAYMSPRCAQLYELQLKSMTNRPPPSVSRGVRDEFQIDCADAVKVARQRLYAERAGKYQAAQELAAKNREATEQQVAAQQTHRAQCAELQSLLDARRKRLPSMGDGERVDLQRFESTFESRCGRK